MGFYQRLVGFDLKYHHKKLSETELIQVNLNLFKQTLTKADTILENISKILF